MKTISYPLHSPVSPSISLPCVAMCHHISTGLYEEFSRRCLLFLLSQVLISITMAGTCFQKVLMFQLIHIFIGRDSSVGMAPELRAGRSGNRILVGARFSAPVQTGPEAHPASCTMGTGSFPGVKIGRGVTLIPHPLLVPWS